MCDITVFAFRRLSQRPTTEELEQRNILKRRCSTSTFHRNVPVRPVKPGVSYLSRKLLYLRPDLHPRTENIITPQKLLCFELSPLVSVTDQMCDPL